MHRPIALLLALISSVFVGCTPPAEEPILTGPDSWMAFRDKNGKWGFKAGNKIVIKATYDAVLPFKLDRARVRIDGKFGFIDDSAELVIPAKYDEADQFFDGLAKVKLGDKYGFLDTSGKTVIPIELDYAESFESGTALVKRNGEPGKIDTEGTFTAETSTGKTVNE